MIILKATVLNNTVSILTPNIKVTEHSLNSIQVQFTLPDDYKDLTCVAVFTVNDKNYKRTINDNVVLIPYDVLIADTVVTLGVYAYTGDTLMYSPKPATFTTQLGSYVSTSEEEKTFTQNDFEKWLEQANILISDFKTYVTGETGASEIANNLINNDKIYEKTALTNLLNSKANVSTSLVITSEEEI